MDRLRSSPDRHLPWRDKFQLTHYRLALEALRDARGPLGTREVAQVVMDRRGPPAGDAVVLRRVENMLKGALRRREGATVESVVNGRRAAAWGLLKP